VRGVGVMPDCGRCLNMGRAGKRGAPPECAQFNRDSGALVRQAQPAGRDNNADRWRGQERTKPPPEQEVTGADLGVTGRNAVGRCDRVRS
jgi:hypothetical protein